MLWFHHGDGFFIRGRSKDRSVGEVLDIANDVKPRSCARLGGFFGIAGIGHRNYFTTPKGGVYYYTSTEHDERTIDMATRTKGPGHDAIYKTVLPSAPLVEHLKTITSDHSFSGLAHAAGKSRWAVARWVKEEKPVRLDVADEVCTFTHTHPTQIG